MNERHQLEEKLQYKFNNKKLLMTAVTHSSYVKEHCHEEKSNERLEFLGVSRSISSTRRKSSRWKTAR